MGTKDKKQGEVELVDNRKNGVFTKSELAVECDFSEVSRKWALEWTEVNQKLIAFQAMYQADNAQVAFEQAGLNPIDAVEQSTQLMRKRNEMMAQVIVEIPREWLMKNAPEEIDWSDPENLLEYVKGEYEEDLMYGVTLARANNSKNSQRTTSTD